MQKCTRCLTKARASEVYKAAARERQKEGGRKGGSKVPAEMPEALPKGRDARDAAGKAFGVGGRILLSGKIEQSRLTWLADRCREIAQAFNDEADAIERRETVTA